MQEPKKKFEKYYFFDPLAANFDFELPLIEPEHFLYNWHVRRIDVSFHPHFMASYMNMTSYLVKRQVYRICSVLMFFWYKMSH